MNLRASHSMRLQTAAIIIAGIVLSHLAAYLLYARDRRDALLVTEALDIAERAAGISRLVRDLPMDWRNHVVAASDSRAFRVWTSAGPAFANFEPTNDEMEILEYLRALLPRISANEMRVRLAPAALAAISAPARAEGQPPGIPSDAIEPGISNRQVAITIKHGNGDWLNFLGQINTPASFLPEFLGLSIISAVFGMVSSPSGSCTE